jgi:cationic amino acid transporter 4
MSLAKFYSMLTRTKDVTTKVTESALHRCLNVFDLTFLGVGATVGAGLYVVTGQVAKEMAGPGIVLSFLIAAVASMLAGLCYAEFGCRVSKAGSAYVYTYATLGEFWGFVIGWNMILEYIIGNASLARGLSDYIDSIFGGAIKEFFITNIGLYFVFKKWKTFCFYTVVKTRVGVWENEN